MNLAKRILIALVLGLFIGLGMNLWAPNLFESVDTYFFTPVGDIFLRLILMMVVPIVFVSIVLGTTSIGDPKKLGKIGGKTILFYLTTTALAISIAMTLALIVRPGKKGVIDSGVDEYVPAEPPSIVDTLLNIIPTNPVEAMVNGDMLQIIFFAVFFGLALAMLGKKSELIKKFLEQLNDVVFYMINVIMYVAPIGAFGLIASAVGNAGIDAITSMFAYFMVVIGALIIHAVVVYGFVIKFMAKKSPIWFFKGFFPAMSVAFGTSSSGATLPVSLKAAQENLGVKKSVSNFVQPLGASINMDGTAIMQGVATVFIAQVVDVDLTITQILSVLLIATLASVGTAAVPAVGLVMLTMVLTSVGLPVEAIGLILGVDRLLDMLRTAVNTTGDAVCAL